MGSNSSWGFKVRSQVAKERSEDFTIANDSETTSLNGMLRVGRECGRESCPGCSDALVYGEWHGRLSFVPNFLENFWIRVV